LTTLIRIIEGTYRLRGEDVDMSGKIFPMAKSYRVGTHGGFVTVDSTPVAGLPNRNIKIFCAGPASYEVVDGVEETPVVRVEPKREETDLEIMNRLRERFQMLTDMTRAIKRGDVRAMIVSGPPGVGKSHEVEAVLDRHQLVDTIRGEQRYEMIKGAISPLGLYCKLYEHKDKHNVVVFDDCDSVFDDPLSLNILKAALDSKKVRTIHWNTDSHKLRLEDIPNSFMFEGSAIFITNLKFDHIRSPKLRDHLTALESRCHYIDLTIDTDREKMLRIRQIVNDGMLTEYDLPDDVKEDIVDFVDDNKPRLRELSLRTVLKITDLAKAFPNRWRSMAENTVFK
jgi:hypothetical protein